MSSARTRSVEFEDPARLLPAAQGKTGLEVLRDLTAGKIAAAPLQAIIGFDLVDAQDGFAKFRATPGEHWFGVMGAVPGGVVATLLDAAMSAAVVTTLDALSTCAPVAFNIHSTRPLTLRTGSIIAEGWVVHRGSRLVTAEARLNDDQARLLAHGSGTFSLTERGA